jgi:NAD+ synthase (glutamine-hydrolysing)
MKIGLLQINFTVGDFLQNAEKIVSAYEKAVRGGADLCVSTELGLCGYPPRDLLNRKDFIQSHDNALKKVAKRIGRTPLLLGGIAPTHKKAGRPLYNATFLLEKGKSRLIAQKRLLPTYEIGRAHV